MYSKAQKDKFDHSVIIRKIFSTRNSFEKEDYISALHSALEMRSEIPFLRQRKIIEDVLYDLKGKNPNFKTVKNNIRHRENKYLTAKFEDYIFYTRISVSRARLAKMKRKLEGCQITFNSKRKLNLESFQLSEKHKKALSKTSLFSTIKILIKARCLYSAFDRGARSINLLRSIWNLGVNSSILARNSSSPKPINNILIGPIHTLYRALDESPISSVYWSEQSTINSDNLRPLADHNKLVKMLENERIIRNKLRNHLYRDELEIALIRYGLALDLSDYQSSFIKLWSLLEMLTHTTGRSYDDTIRRSCFILANKDIHKQILEHLRVNRNAIIHHARDTEEGEVILFQLKRYVERLILFHLFNRYKFISMEEAAKFMDNATDKKILKTKIKDLRKVLKFLN